MTAAKNKFIQTLFQQIKKDTYLLLKWLRNDLSTLEDGSDIDLLIQPTLIKKIEGIINNTSTIEKVKKERGVGVYHYYLFFKNGDFLQLDLLVKLVRKNLVYLSHDYLLKNSITIKGVKTYPTIYLFEHVLLFNYLNYSGLPKKYVNYFTQLPSQKQTYIINYINQKYHTQFGSIKDTAIFNLKHRNYVIKYLNCQRDNSFIQWIRNSVDYLRSMEFLLRNKNSLIITFSGVDGAGKSTIINDFRSLLGDKYRKKVVVLRHRPSLLPIISAWRYGKTKAEQKSLAQLPRQGKNKSQISSYLRFTYYYLDYLLGQFYVWAKYLVPGYIVLYDRYYFDFIVDGRRSNINIGSFLPKKLYPFIMKPKLNCFLYADAATILKRKQELHPSVIDSLTQHYQALFEEFSEKYAGTYLSINNVDKSSTLYTILKHYLNIA